MITPPDQRDRVLLEAGVPLALLTALEDLASLDELEYQIKGPDAAYSYLPCIIHYKILEGSIVTPILSGNNGDTYYVLLQKDEKNRFVYFELGQDEIYEDFGSNVQFLLAHIFIDFFEFSEQSPERIIEIGHRLGLMASKELFEALEGSGGERNTFESDKAWRLRVLPQILGGRTEGDRP